jgi:hypothetical protein
MAMRVQANLKSRLLGSAVAALVAAVSYSAIAGDPVKTRSDYSKPGREIEEGAPVKASASSKSFWQSINDEGKSVKTGDGTKKFGRELDEAAGPPVKTRGATDIPGRALNQEHGNSKAKQYKPLEQ